MAKYKKQMKEKKMTKDPLKEKIKKALVENDRAHENLVVALNKWTTSWDKNCKLIAKILEEQK